MAEDRPKALDGGSDSNHSGSTSTVQNGSPDKSLQQRGTEDTVIGGTEATTTGGGGGSTGSPDALIKDHDHKSDWDLFKIKHPTLAKRLVESGAPVHFHAKPAHSLASSNTRTSSDGHSMTGEISKSQPIQGANTDGKTSKRKRFHEDSATDIRPHSDRPLFTCGPGSYIHEVEQFKKQRLSDEDFRKVLLDKTQVHIDEWSRAMHEWLRKEPTRRKGEY
jgi:hypothetical protein